MRRIIMALAVLILFFVISCTPVPLARLGANPVIWNWGQNASARAITDPNPSLSSLTIAFGIKAMQSGVLTVGNSRIKNKSMAFNIQALSPDGKTLLGTFGGSEEFDVTDPSIWNKPGLPAGTMVSMPYGMLMNRVGESSRTELYLTRQVFIYNPIQADIETIDEAVFRLAVDTYHDAGLWNVSGENQTNGCTIMTQPHFIYTKDGITESYSSLKGNLLVDGDPDYLNGFEYIAFVPASIVGAGFSRVIRGPFSDLSDPTWTSNIGTDTALASMFDTIAGLDNTSPTIVSERATSLKWNSTFEYFNDFFAKYSTSKSIMFSSVVDGRSLCNTSILFVAMNEDLVVGLNQGIQVDVDFSSLDFDINDGIMSITGDPPFKLSTSVIR